MSSLLRQLKTQHLQLITRAYARFVRWAFERFYREFAWTYDVVAALVSGGHWRAWILAAQPRLHGRVLELGCGTGNLQCAFATHPHISFNVGLDVSPYMLAYSRAKLRRLHAPTRLLQGDARALPFASASFDTVVATFPSEYIVAPTTLNEARRVLVSGGRLVVVLGARFAADSLYERLVDVAYRLTLQTSPRPEASTPPTDANQSPEVQRFLDALEQAGFRAQAEWVAAPGGSVLVVTANVMK